MKLVCPSCKADIPAADASLERALARCRRCNEVFGFADLVGNTRPTAHSGRALPRSEVPLPRGYTVDELSGRFRLTQRWFSPKAFFFLFFTLFWNAIVGVFLAGIIAGKIPLPVLAFISLHLIAGVG